MTGEAISDRGGLGDVSRCRRFGISDAMILTAGMAIALSASLYSIVNMFDTVGRLVREASAHAGDLPTRPHTYREAVREPVRNTSWYGYEVVRLGLVGFVPAWIVVRLRGPRAGWRVLVGQPGVVAVLGMVFGLLYGTGALVSFFPGQFDSFNAAPSAIGCGVALGWLALAIGRRWRPEPGWIDRLGRLLGWVAIGLATLRPLILRI